MSTLYLVSTPVGNLGDITFRAIETLKSVSNILAEDTRVTGKLLKHYEIETSMKSYHDHNKEKVTSYFINQLKSGEELALVTDAGTPGIADPAFYIVREALKAGINVVAIPGATAFVPAIITSGLPSDRFIFENFLAPKASKRKVFFESTKDEKRTIVFYETPHRILKVLKEMDEVLGDVQMAVAREITKLYEEVLRGTPKTILEHYKERKPKGEMVVMYSTSMKPNTLFIKE
jgi:16S rRNA (cytidine1402-2'-O)-methyltransferase